MDVEDAARARMHGEDEVLSVALIASTSRRRRSGSVFAARWIVNSAYDVGAIRETLARERHEQVERVAHDVADDLDPAGGAFRDEDRARPVVRRQQQLGEPVDLDPVPFLRHRQVAAAQPGLDVSDRHAGGDTGARAGQRRVRVAVDERPVWALLLERMGDPRLHRVRVRGVEVEPVRGLREPELVEEHLRQLRVVVLAGVQHAPRRCRRRAGRATGEPT